MLLEEFDADKYERCLREEGRKEGREEGRKEGREEGRKEGREEGLEEGEDRMASLIEKLLELNRMEDLKRIATDVDYRERLLREFGI